MVPFEKLLGLLKMATDLLKKVGKENMCITFTINSKKTPDFLFTKDLAVKSNPGPSRLENQNHWGWFVAGFAPKFQSQFRKKNMNIHHPPSTIHHPPSIPMLEKIHHLSVETETRREHGIEERHNVIVDRKLAWNKQEVLGCPRNWVNGL